jgi:hypothetical protein
VINLVEPSVDVNTQLTDVGHTALAHLLRNCLGTPNTHNREKHPGAHKGL